MSEQQNGFKYQEYAAMMGFQVLLTVALHPLEFAEFLLQIGQTPIPGYPKKAIFGFQNTFKLIGHIRSKDGCLGCYRGIMSRIRTRLIGTSVLSAITHNVRGFEPDPESDEDTSLEQFRATLWKEMVEVTIVIIVTQPFTVISWRVMGQFVGREEIYSSFFWSIGEIYSRHGITGFFSGLVPRWLGEAISQAISQSLCYFLNRYVLTDHLHKAVARIMVRYVCYVFTYPLTVASVCYGVNNSGLACGQPPNMPIFHGWLDALGFINRRRKQLKLE